VTTAPPTNREDEEVGAAVEGGGGHDLSRDGASRGDGASLLTVEDVIAWEFVGLTTTTTMVYD